MAKILFLEDEPTIRDVTSEYMKMQNYDVTIACDGKEAIEFIEKEDFDMAILDIMVPGVNGLEVLSYIKQTKPTMATIMLTALGDEQTQIKAFNLFTDDYVIKPFSPLLLLKRMETILRRTSVLDKTSSFLSNNDLTSQAKITILEEAYQAYYDGKPLGLTLSEFLLLQTLMKRPSQVFTREQLILAIFDEEYSGNDRIIDAHVKNLRKKLPHNYIRTVAGVGYQFQEGDA